MDSYGCPFIASHHSDKEEDDPVHVSNCRKPFSLWSAAADFVLTCGLGQGKIISLWWRSLIFSIRIGFLNNAKNSLRSIYMEDSVKIFIESECPS